MKRSERLAREGKVEVYVGSFEVAEVISAERLSRARGLRYVATDFGALYDGREVAANVYESDDGALFAVID